MLSAHGERYEGHVCAVFVDEGELCISFPDQYGNLHTVEAMDPSFKLDKLSNGGGSSSETGGNNHYSHKRKK